MTDDRLRAASDPIGSILRVFKDVTRGEAVAPLELGYPDTHPFGALAQSVNAMVEALADARARTHEYRSELEARLATIEKQRVAIDELSTPIMEVWEGVLCLPVVGVMDSGRAASMTGALLHAIAAKKAAFVIIDITGIDVMDTHATDHFLRMARAVRLLGARCALSGANPTVARTVAQIGIDLGDVDSHRSLRDALFKYVRSQGHAQRPSRGAPARRRSGQAGPDSDGRRREKKEEPR